MDLPAEAERLRLDALAVELSAALTAADVPHALLKGPSTSLWLYDPPRPYRDVDLLVPLSRLRHAVAALADAGLARRAGGRVGEEAPHSLMLRSTDGFEVDLHVALPTTPVDGDRYWAALAPHVVTLDLGVGRVPAFDEVGRCLVLALHAVGGGRGPGQPLEDLERARRTCAPATWDVVAGLAERIGVADLVNGGIALADGAELPALTLRARLHSTSAPAEAIGLARIAQARGRERARLIAREVLPSEGFLRWDDPTLPATRRALVGAHVRRWLRIVHGLPAGVRAYRAARLGAQRRR